MTKDEAIKYGKEQLDVFGGKHAEFIKSVIELLEQGNVLEIIKRRLENEEEMAFASFEEYAELYGYNETEDYFSFGLKRAIEIINVYIKLEKDEN